MKNNNMNKESNEEDEAYAAKLHQELLEISNQSLANRNRFHVSEMKNVVVENDTEQSCNHFLKVTKEQSIFNQYWYSENTIRVFMEAIEEISANCKSNDPKQQPVRIAFLSTPSLYFALPMEQREHCKLFEYDHQWANDEGFVPFDFHTPTKLDASLKGNFDIVIIDPPFITRNVWEQYAMAAHFLLKNDLKEKGIVIGTTVKENQDVMMELFHASPTVFKPVVTNLVYQYTIFINCISTVLSVPNPELPQEEVVEEEEND